jgi:DNA polymerase
MPVLFLDYETFYSDEYSLKKLTPPQYVLDPRYETIGCSAAVDDETPYWVDGPDFPKFISQFDPATTSTVTFNALFDNCILAWKYNFLPARMYCSMRMAAALRGHILTSVSLKNVAKVLGLGEKGDTIVNVKGMRRQEIMNDPALWRAFQAYANNDNELSRRIFQTLLPEFPSVERRVMDRVLRCAVEPGFVVDQTLLRDHLADMDLDRFETLLEAAENPDAEKFTSVRTLRDSPGTPGEGAAAQEALNRLVEKNALAVEEIARSLRSNDKFEEILKKRGIDVGYKPSATDPTRQIPAFAKTDEFMAELQEHEDPFIQSLAVARLGLRSTIERSRGEKIMSIASLPWPSYCAGNMPIPLRYSGAHTHRLSGEWKINMQNLPAGRDKKRPSKLRKSLKAPAGKKVLVADLSQIECRIAAWLCGEVDLLDQFATKKDPYMILGEKIFSMPPGSGNKKTHELERFIGKSGVLGLGFGCGFVKFYNMVLRSARGMHMDMTKLLAFWTENMARVAVDTYRLANPNIRGAWAQLDAILNTSWCGATGPIKWGPNGVVEIGHGYVLLPNGMKLLYDVLPRGDDGWSYRYGKKTHKMYGSKFLENIVQALARIVVMNAALRLWDRGYRFKLQAHDELAFIVDEADAENAKAIVLEEMRRRPSWSPDLPLDAEANYGDSYGDAK